MIIKNNEDLRKHTTVRIGGTAKNYYVPESLEELTGLLQKLRGETYRILGCGSNLLINDTREYEHVISLLKCCCEIAYLGKGRFYAGCSVKLYSLITAVNEKGYGGIEYLTSVPGSVGGAIVMNAGRGRSYHQSISDYIESVVLLENGQQKELPREECGFGYRDSIFKSRNLIVIGAFFHFQEGSPEIYRQKREERLSYAKAAQDHSGYNFGSVFSESSLPAMFLIRMLGLGRKDGVHFSPQTPNWIVNHGNGTYEEAVRLIEKAEKINRCFGKTAKREVITWE